MQNKTADEIQQTITQMDHLVQAIVLHHDHLVKFVETRIMELSYEKSRFGSDQHLSNFIGGKIEALKEVLPVIKGDYPSE